MIKILVSEPSLLLNSKLNEYTSQIIEEKDEFNYCVFDFEETPFEEIILSLQSPSFTSQKKVVIAKNPYFIKNDKVKLPFTNDIEQLIEYFKSPNPDCELIIICSKSYFTNKSKFLSSVNKYCVIENLLLDDENEFKNYGEALINKIKLKIDYDAKDLLFLRCMGDICKLEREIAKLSLYGDNITLNIVNKMVSRPLQDDIFELSNALLTKNKKKAMKIYNDLKLLKMEPISIIGLLANQYRLLLQVSILKNKKMTENEIADFLSIHPYRIKIALKNLMYYNITDIKNTLINLATLDAKIKSGEYDRFVNLEMLLATM